MRELTVEERIRRWIRLEEKILKVKKKMAWRRVKSKILLIVAIAGEISVVLNNYFWKLEAPQFLFSLLAATMVAIYYIWQKELEKLKETD